MSRHRWDHHPPCRCGCGELADECAGPRPNPLGSMRIEEPALPWVPRHNHFTRDVKPEGQCPDCDRYHESVRAHRGAQ